MNDDLQSLVIDWFKANQRDLPWRRSNPWGVLVSEFMLQQTQVSRVLPIWEQWMERWPTPSALAAEPKAAVIRAWGGLGYPRRALRLLETARIIAAEHKDEVPSTYEDLIALPGVGDYCASAILAFAFHQPALVLDVNIRRFFARHIDGIGVPTSAPTKPERSSRAELIPAEEGHLWAAATMEFGALICTAQTPKCNLCFLAEGCAWRINDYPQEAKRTKQAAFAGSDRQCRGTVLRALRHEERLTYVEVQALWENNSQLEKALKTLIADGFIEAIGDQEFQLVQEG
jgi:A/G-specific adenine glycosylase